MIDKERRKNLLKQKGFVLHRGTVGGEKYVVIATMRSANVKTGNMVQIWFLLENQNPCEAVKSKLDAKTICKGCVFASGNGCYVNVGQAPLGIWKAYHKNRYNELSEEDYGLIFKFRSVRFGAYGNPTLLPIEKVRAIAKACDGWTGYFHDWKEMRPAKRKEYGEYFMASTENTSRLKSANRMKLRSFHVSDEQPKGTIECLSESKGITCEKCKLCSGTLKKGKPSVWIAPHGGGGKPDKAKTASQFA